jgi:hypothetical protein
MPIQSDLTLQPPSGIPVAFERNARSLPSFWYVQLAGWATFFLFVLLATAPGLKHLETLWDDFLTVVFMFLGSCMLRPICKRLQRSPLSWLQVEARTLAWCLVAGPIASFVAELLIMAFRRVPAAEFLVVAVQFTIVLFLWCNLYLNAKYRQQVA